MVVSMKGAYQDYTALGRTAKYEKIKNFANWHLGKRLCAIVLYLGASFQKKSGIIYLNICDFLLALNKHKDLQIAMDELG